MDQPTECVRDKELKQRLQQRSTGLRSYERDLPTPPQSPTPTKGHAEGKAIQLSAERRRVRKLEAEILQKVEKK